MSWSPLTFSIARRLKASGIRWWIGCGRCSARACIATWPPSGSTSCPGGGIAAWSSRWACCRIAAIGFADGSGDSGMTALARLGAPAFSAGFGLLMVGLAGLGSQRPAVVAGVAALIAVGAGTVFRFAATLGVLLSVVTIVLS